jgi:hypothetical protein
VGESEHTVGKATAQIDWRKLLLPTLFVMVLPTIAAVVLDMWLGTLPLITIAAIVICFPLSTFLVTKIALSEMDRVIAEVAPPLPLEETPFDEQLLDEQSESEVTSEEVLPPDVEPSGETPTGQGVGRESLQPPQVQSHKE